MTTTESNLSSSESRRYPSLQPFSKSLDKILIICTAKKNPRLEYFENCKTCRLLLIDSRQSLVRRQCHYYDQEGEVG